MLLYFYQLQRTTPLAMPQRQLGFVDKKESGVLMSSDKKWLTKDLQTINASAADIYNAFRFLLDRKYIESVDRNASGAKIFVGIHVAFRGVDIIESVENGPQGQEQFANAFNMPVPSDGGVEGLIKDALRALLD